MTVRETSLEAYRAIEDALPEARRSAYRFVLDHPGCTALELEAIAETKHIPKRLTELERMGVIENRETRVCTRSGHRAMTWYPVEGATLRSLPSSSGWKARALAAEARAEELERRLAALEVGTSPQLRLC